MSSQNIAPFAKMKHDSQKFTALLPDKSCQESGANKWLALRRPQGRALQVAPFNANIDQKVL
jgi:hypothetical protein